MKICALICLACFACFANAKDTVPINTSKLDWQVKNVMQYVMKKYNVPGAAVLSIHENLI